MRSRFVFGPDFRRAVSAAPLILALAGLGLPGPPARAQSCDPGTILSPSTEYSVGSYPLAVDVADFNGDMLPDIVSVDYSSGSVSILDGVGEFGVPTGTFAAARKITIGSGPRNIVIGDFNRDGVLDLAVVKLSSPLGVALLVGENANGVGTGTFLAPVVYPINSPSRGIAVADFNEDGRADLAVASDNGLNILFGTTGGGFTTAAHFGTLSAWGVGVGDFDEDGYMDVVCTAPTTNNLALYRGRGTDGVGDGTFWPPDLFGMVGGSEHLVVADFNGDGHLDVATAPGNGVWLLAGDGDGGFAEQTRIFYGTCTLGIAVGHMDLGPGLDLVVTESCTGKMWFVSGNGDGTFGIPASYPVGGIPTDIVSADVDLDGSPDVVVANAGEATVSVLRSNCPLSPGPPVISAFSPDTAIVGASVTIHGQHLDGATEVAFAGIPAAIVSVDYFNIDVLVPEGVVDGPISVTTPLGTAVSAGDFIVAHLPELDQAVPDAAKFGREVALLGLYLAGVKRVSFGPASSAAIKSQTDTELHVIVDTSAVSGPITLASRFGDAESPFSFTVIPPEPRPIIGAVRDVPSDDGGSVLILWAASDFDWRPFRRITGYRVWRRAPYLMTAAADAGNRFTTRATVAPDGSTGLTYWENVGELPASYREGYAFTAHTFDDSTRNAVPYVAFFVQALTGDPFDFYESPVDSGYSVDNNSPHGPAKVIASQTVEGVALSWDANAEPDLEGYRVYRGTAAAFAPSEENRISAGPDTFCVDVGGDLSLYTYKVSAVDVHGNESAFTIAGAQVATGLGARDRASIDAVRPNPARRDLWVTFSLVQGGAARLDIVDVAGRRVISRDLSGLGAGTHDVRFDGIGAVPPGIYVVRLTQGASTLTRRVAIFE